MKKLMLFIIVLCSVQLTFGQRNFTYGKRIDGIWGNWTGSGLVCKGDYKDLFVYRSNDHPSNYIFRLKISGMEKLFSSSKEDKKLRKEHLKENKWYEFEGELYFYGARIYKDFFSSFPNIYLGATSEPLNGGRVKVNIKVAPFKDKHGIQTYNINYDGLGLGIQL